MTLTALDNLEDSILAIAKELREGIGKGVLMEDEREVVQERERWIFMVGADEKERKMKMIHGRFEKLLSAFGREREDRILANRS